MTTYLRVANAIVSVLILAACAANTPGVKQMPAASPLAAQNHSCLTQTGSRLAADNADCSAFGRSYSREDIDRTGSVTAAEALRLLDPSITVHR
jgi:hypothetical protein